MFVRLYVVVCRCVIIVLWPMYKMVPNPPVFLIASYPVLPEYLMFLNLNPVPSFSIFSLSEGFFFLPLKLQCRST